MCVLCVRYKTVVQIRSSSQGLLKFRAHLGFLPFNNYHLEPEPAETPSWFQILGGCFWDVEINLIKS